MCCYYVCLLKLRSVDNSRVIMFIFEQCYFLRRENAYYFCACFYVCLSYLVSKTLQVIMFNDNQHRFLRRLQLVSAADSINVKHFNLYSFKQNVLKAYNVLRIRMLSFLSATFYLSVKIRRIFIYVCIVYHYIIKYILINSIQNCVFLFSDLECVTFYYIFVYT